MKRSILIKAGIVLLIAAALVTIGLIVLHNQDQAQYAEKRGAMSDGFGQLKTVEYNGVTYREKPAVTTILIAGIDKVDENGNTVWNQYRNGGQADFLTLIAIDHTDKAIHQLQIDRDTMTDVTVLGTFGNETGTRILQICLAHGFGKTPEDNAKYTMRAVQNLLDGVELDGYYMIPYSAVPVVNDALGGVTVDIAFDMTSIHPEWTEGATVTLHGKEAEEFVRSRKTVGAGTNEERMVRQNEFMQKAVAQMNRKITADLGFGEILLGKLQAIATTNFTMKRLTEELSKAYNYEVQTVAHPEGEYSIGEDGFMEFHMRDGAATEWVLENLYTKVG